MSREWNESCVGRLRKFVGHRKLIVPSIGDEFQGFEFLYRVDQWSGTLVKVTEETIDAEFFPTNNLPQLEPGYWADHQREVFEDLHTFHGVPKIK